MLNLSGKNVIITGATGGLGQGIAKKFVQQGATVVLTGTRPTELEKLAETLGANSRFLVCNLTQTHEVDQLIQKAEELVGQIDILINNAGITRDNLFVRMSDEDFRDVLTVNLEAPFRLMRNAIRGMLKKRWGRIINITSVVGITGNPGQANYAAAKAGIIGMSKSIAAEVGSRNITVNCIAPGFMISPMTENLSEEQKQKIHSTIPLQRMGSADDVGNACVFLASEEAGYITGQTFHVNGGMVMC